MGYRKAFWHVNRLLPIDRRSRFWTLRETRRVAGGTPFRGRLLFVNHCFARYLMTLIVLLSVLIGFLLGLLGGGGSLLTLPMLVYLAGVPPKEAIATSLLVVGTTSAVAAIGRALNKQVCWKAGLTFGIAAMSGAYAGGRFAEFVPTSVLLLLFAMIMFATAVAMLGREQDEPHSRQKGSVCPGNLRFLAILFDGAIVGCLSGLVGAGGGFLIVPALSLLGRLPMAAAVGTSLMVLTLQSFAALAGHAQHVQIDPSLAGPIVAGCVLGSILGGKLSGRFDGRLLRRLFGVLVLGVASYLVYREVHAPAFEELALQLASRIPQLAETRLFWIGLTTALLGLIGLYGVGAWLHSPLQRRPPTA